MSGFLRFAAFFALLLAALVLVVLPLALSPLLTQMVRDMGLRSDTLEVSVTPFDPSLILGRSREVRLVADGVDVPPGRIGSVDIRLGEASYFDRTFETVTGELRDVSVAVGGDEIRASSISLSGPAAAAGAVARFSEVEAERLIRLAAQRAGVAVDRVRVTDSGVTVKLHGVEAVARVTVRGGALLLQPSFGGAVVLLQPVPSDPWSLSEAWISADGLNVRGEVDIARLARQVRQP